MKIILKINKDKPHKSCDLPTIMTQVKSVIGEGFCSKGTYGRQFCFATVFADGTEVYCDKLKSGTHKFIINTI